ncbi:MAG TPA: S41 family peptidase [Solirubrobacterales bacterium]|nr:S41 family peptidase [Solirubrobacterales bacterium]
MRAAWIAALGAALLLALGAGIWLGGHPATLPSFLRDRLVGASGGISAEATELIEENYYQPANHSSLTDSSLGGMVRGLRRHFHDRYSEYFAPKAATGFNEELDGHYSGVGIEIALTARGILTKRVLPESPARKAGIVHGDVIISVEGRPLAGKSLLLANKWITGPEGTSVRLGIVRPGRRGVESVRVTRAEIATPVTFTQIKRVDGRKLGYLRYSSFTAGSDKLVAKALRRLEREGAQGIVLDLRGNGGGFLQEAVAIASLFMAQGKVVVSTTSRADGNSVYRSSGGDLVRIPLVVLIDRDTASSAEILTAALADDVGATVVGTRSYGKGVFQQEIPLANGGALKLTVGQYFTPRGVNLAGKGIHPDVYVRDNPRTRRDEAMQRALAVLAHRVPG